MSDKAALPSSVWIKSDLDDRGLETLYASDTKDDSDYVEYVPKAQTPVLEFAVKHDMCDYGREMIRRFEPQSLEEFWAKSDSLGIMFMYVKAVKGSYMPFLDFADRIERRLWDDGFESESQELRRYIAKVSDEVTRYRSLRQDMIANIAAAPQRQHASEKAMVTALLMMARDIALYALDYSSQVRFGKFNVKYSFSLADDFRQLVGANPFIGQ